MPRTSPLGIDGVSLEWRTDSSGRVNRVLIRVRDKAGEYQSRVFPVVTRDRDGTPHVPIDGKQWAQTTRGGFLAGTHTAGKALLADAVVAFADDATSRGLTAKYIDEVKKIITSAAAEPGMRDLQDAGFPDAARRWIDRSTTRTLRRIDGRLAPSGRPLSAYTKNKRLQHLRTVVHFAHARGWLPRDPLMALRRAKVPSRNKATFTLDELALTATPKARAHGYWLRWWLLIHGGFRAQEMLHLRWQDTDWKRMTIGVKYQPGVYSLKRDKERDVPLQPALSEVLKTLEQPAGWIIADAQDRNSDNKVHQRRFAEFLTDCGIAIGDRTPHSTRHTWAALCIASGAPTALVKTWAGHSVLATTEGYVGAAANLERVVRNLGWTRGEFDLATIPRNES